MSDAAPGTPEKSRRLGALRNLWPYMRRHRALALGWLVFLALSSGSTLVFPMAVRQMIDHGFAFNGPNWNFVDTPLMGLYPRRLVYEQVRSLADFQPWLDQVMHFPEEIFDAAFKQVPPEWIEGEEDEFEQLLEQLLERRKLVPELITETRRAKSNPFPNWR